MTAIKAGKYAPPCGRRNDTAYPIPSSDTIWHYAAGVETREEHEAVERFFKAFPDRFEDLATMRRQLDVLNSVPEDVLDEPVPERLSRIISNARLRIARLRIARLRIG